MTGPGKTWQQRHRTALRLACIGLAVLYAFYLLLANVFLNTSLADLALNRKPERFHIQWRSAFSVYPGHIHARGLRVQGHARTTAWTASASSADGRVKLLPLLARRLSFGNIGAREVDVAVERAPDLPPPRPATVAAAARGPWELHFAGIATDSLRTLRMGDWVVEGGGRARFALDKVLRGGTVEVLPSTLRMPSATLRRGDLVLARQARIELDLSMAPNTRKLAQGYEKVRFIDARLQLDGRSPGIGVHEDAAGKLAVATSSHDGRIQADLSIRRGALQPGGRVQWEVPVTLDSNSSVAQGYRLRVDAQVQDEGIAVQARVPKRPGREDFLEAQLLVGERRMVPPPTAGLLRTVSGDIKGQWHFATLRWLNPMLSYGWLRLDGAADVTADLHLQKGKLQPGSHAEILRAQVQADVFDTVATGSANAKARVEQGRTTVDFTARRFALAPKQARSQVYVTGQDLTMRLLASQDLAEFRRTLQAHVRFAGARVPDLRAYNRNLPAGGLQLEGGSGTLGADLHLDAKGQVRNGNVQVKGQRAVVRFGPTRATGDLALDTRVAHAGGGPRRYRIELLKVGLDRVRVDGAKAGSAPWWARLDFRRGMVDVGQPLALQGDAKLVMKDVSALLDVYADRSAFPKWIGKLVDEGQASADARVRVDGKSVTLDQVRARNDRVDLDARLRVANGKSEGALYARWGILGIGAETHGGKRKLHVVGAEEWYKGLPPMQASSPPPRVARPASVKHP